ncbi:MAG: MopE-related protein [Myxococcota bacterium]
MTLAATLMPRSPALPSLCLGLLLLAGCSSGTVEPGGSALTVDADHDGYTTQLDCDDDDAAVHPGSTEVCGDSVDQDCAGGDLVCPTDTTAPMLSGGQPSGVLPGGTTQATLRVTTNEAATCKWDTSAGTAYVAMASTFTTTGSTSHNTPITGLADGQSYTYYVRCQDAVGNATTSDYVVTFDIRTDAGPIVVSLVASRASGVAPLSVFFDASGTTDTAVTSQPFHDLEYRWEFGDPANGATWAYGAQPSVSRKNLATGPVAAHVFETPGTYTVALSVFDGTHTATAETTITVSDPEVVFAGTSTICVAASSLPVAGADGCPAGANTAQQSSFSAALSSYATTGTRVLFKRGDTFSNASTSSIADAGPGTLGAYGTGALPIVQASNNTVIRFGTDLADWRVMDLTIDGMSGASSAGFASSTNAVSQITMLRMDIKNVGRGYGFTFFDTIIADSRLDHIVASGYQGMLAGYRFAILGSSFTDATLGQTMLRFPRAVKVVISNNTLSGSAPTYELVKLHGLTWCETGCDWEVDTAPVDAVWNNGTTTFGYSEKVLLSDNKLVGGTSSPWMMTAGPQNGTWDERVRDVIFERNWVISGADTQTQLVIMCRDVSVRNNICDVSGNTQGGTCFEVGVWGVEPPSDNVAIYENTMYTSVVSAQYFSGVRLKAAVTDVTVINNLAYAPLSSPIVAVMIEGTGASGLVASNNSSNAQLRGVSPSFATTSPVTPDDFRITAGSYALGAGAAVPVWSDFFWVPQPAARDLGAVIH